MARKSKYKASDVISTKGKIVLFDDGNKKYQSNVFIKELRFNFYNVKSKSMIKKIMKKNVNGSIYVKHRWYFFETILVQIEIKIKLEKIHSIDFILENVGKPEKIN